MNAWLHELNASAAPMLLDHVWPMLWQSSLLIVLVALAGRTIFRKASPQLRYALWSLVLIRLVVPPWVDLPTALGHWGMPEVRQHVAAFVPLDAAAPAATAMLQRPLVGGVSPALSNGVTDGGAQVLSAVTPPIQWSLALLVIGLWGLGVASLLLLLLARLFRMHRDVKRGAPAPAWIGEAVARYRTTLGVRLPVRIRVVPGNQSPALMGLIRPTILLPQGALDNLREDQLRAVLAHEIAHVKRWDFVVNWAQVLLGIVYFFHPLLWFANREMRRERELACDDLTLITLGLNREGYAESLLCVAEGLSTVRRLAPVQVGVMEGELELARRLRRILDQKIRPVPRLTALSLVAVLAFAALFGTWHPSVAENKSEVALPMEEVETRIFDVKVVDEAGQPLEGADVSLVFVRTGVDWGSTPGLLPGFGKPDTVKTNTAGMAAVRYPRYVVEKIETAFVALKAGHVEYVSGVQVELNVNEPSPIIVLDRGATLRVSGYIGERHNTVTPLFAKLSGSPVADWRPAEDGILERRDLWAKQHYLLLIHQDREGFFYFTDYFRFYPTQGMTHEFNLPLQKGVQLTGKISESVARPVKNGWVEVRVLPILEVNSDRYGEGNLEWTAHSAIKEDGSFLIEGLPRGRGRITAACDGAVSMGEPGPHGMGTPIVTMLDGGANGVEVTMIRTATAVVRVIGPDGKPVAGAKVGFWPLVGGDDQYFAYFRRMEFASAEAINMPLEESATDWQGMADDFSHTSDANGIATVENLPPWVPRFSVVSEDFELPPDVTGARRRSIELRPGETTEVAVELVAKEADLPMADAPVASAAATEREKANASSPVAPAEPETDQSEAAAPTEEVEMKTLEVKVADEAGEPLEGVELEVQYLRPVVNSGSSYMWGPITGKTKHQTNADGTASVRYPRYVREKMETGVVGLRTKLHGFAAMPSVELNADGTSPPIVMAVAASVRMSAYIGSEENPVSPIIARFGGPDGYNGEVNGEVVIERRDLREGLYWIWLGHVDEDGTKYFSEAVQFEAAKGEFRGYSLPLRKGVKLSGRLDDTVPRPVRNGWVEAHVFPPEIADRTAGSPGYVDWSAHAPVRDDGTFELDGLPLGYAAVTAGCDGAISTGERRPGYDTLGFPIMVSLTELSTDVELAMIATATAVIRAVGPKGEPVAGAMIDFWPNMNYPSGYTTVMRNPLIVSAESQAREYTGVTDDTGTALIENLPPWVPEFFVTSDGYELPKASEEDRKQSIELHPGKTTEVTAQLVLKGTDFLGAGVEEPTSAPVPVAVPEESVDPTKALDPPDPFALPTTPSSPTNRLEGRIVDETGKPLSGVFVDVWTQDTGTEMETDSDGHFALDVYLQFGDSVEVRFMKEGYSPVYIYRQPPGILAQPIVMTTRTFIEGTVRDSVGKPVSGVLVRADSGLRDTDSRVLVMSVVPETVTEMRTAADGSYHLKVQEGTYTVTVSNGEESATLGGVEVARFEGKRLDIQLSTSPVFRARILDAETSQPVAGMRVAYMRTPELRSEGISDAEGNVSISGVPEGQFVFEILGSELDYTRLWSEVGLDSRDQKDIRDDGWQFNFNGLTFKVARDMEPVTIIAEKGARVRGRVIDPDGKPVAGATVAPALTGTSNSLTGDTRFSVTTNDQGSFDMLLPASKIREYNLIAHDGDYEEWRTWANGVMDPISTQPGNVIENVEISLQRPCVIRGKAVDDAGNPLVDREVRAAAKAQNDNRYYVPTTRTDAEGNFELKFVAPGEHYVQAAPFWLDPAEAPEGSTQVVVAAVDAPVEGVTLVRKREE